MPCLEIPVNALVNTDGGICRPTLVPDALISVAGPTVAQLEVFFCSDYL